jgi:hypothetical protein
MDTAFEFIVNNGGLTTEGNYPYTGVNGTCNSNRASSSAASITGHEDVPANDEASLQKAVAAQPVSVALDGGDNIFRFYKGGVLSGDCGTDLDHGVTAVGYGVDDDAWDQVLGDKKLMGHVMGRGWVYQDGEGHRRQGRPLWPRHAAFLPDGVVPYNLVLETDPPLTPFFTHIRPK